MGDDGKKSLGPEQLFYMSCREALRDGNIEGPENAFLNDLRLSLMLSSDKVRAIYDRAQREYQQGLITPGGALEPERVYQNACRIAWRDGVVTEQEEALLLRLGELLGLSRDEQARLYLASIPPHLRGEVDESPPGASADPEAASAPRPPSSSPPASAAPSKPTPSSVPKAAAAPSGAAARAPGAPTDVAAVILKELDTWEAEGVLAPFVAAHLRQRYQDPGRSRAASTLAELRAAVPAPTAPEPAVELHIEDPEEEVAEGSVPEAGYADVMGSGGEEQVLHIVASDVPDTADAPAWEMSSTALLAVLGALCLGVGAIMLVAANWHRITPNAKVIMVLCAVTSAYLGAYEGGLRENRAPVTGYAMVILGSLLYAGGIALVAQVYHLNTHFPLGFLAWALGTLPVAYVARSRALLHAVVVVLGAWTMSEQASEARSLTWLALVMPLQLRLVNPLFPFLVAGSAWASMQALGGAGVLSTAGIVTWLWLLAVPVEKTFAVSIELTITFGLLLLAVRLWRSRHAAEGFGRFGYLLSLGGAFVFSFSGAAKELCKGIAAQHTELGWAAVAVAWLVHLATIGAWYLARDEAKDEADRWVAWVGLGAAVAATSVWVLWPMGKYPVSIVFNLLFVIVCLGSLRAGVLQGDAGRARNSQFWILVWVGSRWFEWFGSMSNAGISLMVGGGFLLGVGFAMETWRKSLQAEARGRA